MTYPEKRDLDGIYFRVQRDGRWQNICWTDLTNEECDRMSNDRPDEWWQSMAGHLADTAREISDQFGVGATCWDIESTLEDGGSWRDKAMCLTATVRMLGHLLDIKATYGEDE